MKSLAIAVLIALIATHVKALVLSTPSQNCSTFAQDFAQSVSSQNATIINSTLVPANSAAGNNYTFCKVYGQVAYAGNDTLNFQLYLPEIEMWSGRFMAVGNGGMAGTIDTANMIKQLNLGFAVAGGDSGHLASLNNNGGGAPGVYLPYMHSPAQLKTWIHNAISTFTPPARSLVSSYYSRPAGYSYYNGCSTGGAQGFALAQFHPELFDGIYAGSPGNWYSHLALSFLWNARKTLNESYIPQITLDAITSAVLEECDLLDGVKDGLIENPLKCSFDINTMACNASSTNTSLCLTAPQLEAAKSIYTGPTTTTTTTNGSEIYPGFSLGSESSWLQQEGSLADAFSIPILQNIVFNSLSYDFRDFDWDKDIGAVDEKVGAFIDEISPDLESFRNKGGKLLVTQGWADAYNAAIWPIQHLQDIEAFFNGDVSDFFNLFMVPGGGHCGQAEAFPQAPGTYHVVDALIKWVEREEKPESVVSTDEEGGSRLLCPWPQAATWLGGDIDVASSYVCENS
ncbi:related to feruloyl esterase B precursor [Phialocephala subalpina]|uniref:Carboxylic ester hydrolase n=1 Tax=Phialocephala subalpina TaxID=576137 RepID=A0A1L7WJ52_9HELO|nr:related to feruloyl esterase B precursor [Phialocephala subalpina]